MPISRKQRTHYMKNTYTQQTLILCTFTDSVRVMLNSARKTRKPWRHASSWKKNKNVLNFYYTVFRFTGNLHISGSPPMTNDDHFQSIHYVIITPFMPLAHSPHILPCLLHWSIHQAAYTYHKKNVSRYKRKTHLQMTSFHWYRRNKDCYTCDLLNFFKGCVWPHPLNYSAHIHQHHQSALPSIHFSFRKSCYTLATFRLLPLGYQIARGLRPQIRTPYFQIYVHGIDGYQQLLNISARFMLNLFNRTSICYGTHSNHNRSASTTTKDGAYTYFDRGGLSDSRKLLPDLKGGLLSPLIIPARQIHEGNRMFLLLAWYNR